MLTDSSANSRANALVVQGGNVYIAGASFGVATIWKNGVAMNLAAESGWNSVAYAIAVAGNDVYTAGYIATLGYNTANYWKNTTTTRLIDSSANVFASGLAVNGGDVYVAGYTDETYSTFATCWKNSVQIMLPNGPGHFSQATSITAVQR